MCKCNYLIDKKTILILLQMYCQNKILLLSLKKVHTVAPKLTVRALQKPNPAK